MYWWEQIPRDSFLQDWNLEYLKNKKAGNRRYCAKNIKIIAIIMYIIQYTHQPLVNWKWPLISRTYLFQRIDPLACLLLCFLVYWWEQGSQNSFLQEGDLEYLKYLKNKKAGDSIQIMNVYECNGTNIFMRWKMKCSIQRGEAELNGTFHLSPNENICSIARMRNIHYLFYITCTKVQIPKQN